MDKIWMCTYIQGLLLLSRKFLAPLIKNYSSANKYLPLNEWVSEGVSVTLCLGSTINYFTCALEDIIMSQGHVTIHVTCTNTVNNNNIAMYCTLFVHKIAFSTNLWFIQYSVICQNNRPTFSLVGQWYHRYKTLNRDRKRRHPQNIAVFRMLV